VRFPTDLYFSMSKSVLKKNVLQLVMHSNMCMTFGAIYIYIYIYISFFQFVCPFTDYIGPQPIYSSSSIKLSKIGSQLSTKKGP